jgi:Protein of unknown function (DUF2938)
MEAEMELVAYTALIGIAATVTMDLWALLLKRAFGVASLDYGLVGRWLGHMPAGRLRHANIATAPAMRGERTIGWVAHYAIGVIFAGLLVAAFGQDWVRQPSPGPAIVVGLVTVTAPFFVMQPCMGFGIAASRRPRPTLMRLRSLMTHVIFGLGLYASAWMLAQVMPQ